MASLNTVLKKFDIHFQKSERLFYKKYPYRVTIALDEIATDIDDSRPANFNESPNFRIRPAVSHQYRYWESQRRQEAYRIAKLKGLPAKSDLFKFRKEQRTCSLFFLNETDAIRYIKANKHFVSQVSGPATAAELEFMKLNQRIRVKNRLFWNKYRYCVVFKFLGRNADAVQNWFGDFLSHLEPEARQARFMLSLGYPSKVYVSEESDALMVNLAFHEYILCVEKVILRDEVNDQSHSDAETD